MPYSKDSSLLSSLIVFSAQPHFNRIGNIVPSGLNENIALTLGDRKDCTCGRSCLSYTCHVSNSLCNNARIYPART